MRSLLTFAGFRGSAQPAAVAAHAAVSSQHAGDSHPYSAVAINHPSDIVTSVAHQKPVLRKGDAVDLVDVEGKASN